VSCPRGSRNKLCGLGGHRALSEARNACEDLIGGFGPDERFGIGVMRVDEFLNRRFQLGHTAVRAATRSVRRERRWRPILALHWHDATAEGASPVHEMSLRVIRLAYRRIVGSVPVYPIAVVLVISIVALALLLVVPF